MHRGTAFQLLARPREVEQEQKERWKEQELPRKEGQGEEKEEENKQEQERREEQKQEQEEGNENGGSVDDQRENLLWVERILPKSTTKRWTLRPYSPPPTKTTAIATIPTAVVAEAVRRIPCGGKSARSATRMELRGCGSSGGGDGGGSARSEGGRSCVGSERPVSAPVEAEISGAVGAGVAAWTLIEPDFAQLTVIGCSLLLLLLLVAREVTVVVVVVVVGVLAVANIAKREGRVLLGVPLDAEFGSGDCWRERGSAVVSCYPAGSVGSGGRDHSCVVRRTWFDATAAAPAAAVARGNATVCGAFVSVATTLMLLVVMQLLLLLLQEATATAVTVAAVVVLFAAAMSARGGRGDEEEKGGGGRGARENDGGRTNTWIWWARRLPSYECSDINNRNGCRSSSSSSSSGGSSSANTTNINSRDSGSSNNNNGNNNNNRRKRNGGSNSNIDKNSKSSSSSSSNDIDNDNNRRRIKDSRRAAYRRRAKSMGKKGTGLWVSYAAGMFIARARGQEQESEREGALVVTLAPVGLQYTADVTVSNGNYTSVAALLLDTTLSIIAVRACVGSDTDAQAVNDGGGSGSSDDDDGCIPYGVALEANATSDWFCDSRTVDNGVVALLPVSSETDVEPVDVQLTFLENQDVSLVGASGTTGLFNISAAGEVFVAWNMTSTADSTIEAWGKVGGVLGLARFPQRPCMANDSVDRDDRSVFSELLRDGDLSSAVFALDLGDEDYSSTLEIGGYSGASSGSVGDVIWGEDQAASFPNAWGFPVFDLGVCGRSLLHNITSSWPAVLATGSACLGLPAEMFDSLMAWLPVERPCLVDSINSKTVCYVSAAAAESELPWLSFSLSQSGKTFHVPLSSLLLDEERVTTSADSASGSDGAGSKRLCITRGSSIFAEQSEWRFNLPKNQPFISLGTLPLRSLYAVVDATQDRMGLAQKQDNATLRESGDGSCEPAAVCEGMQRFKESANVCEAPRCSAYFFSHLDEDTNTCISSGGLKVLAWTLGTIFGLSEMIGHFLRAYYGGTGVALRGHRQHHGWEFQTGRYIETFLGKATRAVGWTGHRRTE